MLTQFNRLGCGSGWALLLLGAWACSEADAPRPTGATSPSDAGGQATDAGTAATAATDAGTAATDAGTPAASDAGAPARIPEDAIADYFPMAVGATWTYRHTKVGEATWDEIVTMSAASGSDAPGFSVTDNPNRNGETTKQLWRWVDGEVARISRQELLNGKLSLSTSYDPGFTRFDTRWREVGFKRTVTYTRTAQSTGKAAQSENRTQQFQVLDIDATVAIDAVTYDGCLLVSRTRPDTGEVGHYWFAPGIGKVKELDLASGTTEELVDFSIPD